MTAHWEVEDTSCMIGIPYMGPVSLEWALMFRQVILPKDSFVMTSSGMPIDIAREKIVKSFMKRDFQWLFFLDSDIHIQPDTIMKMISKKLPILSGLYYTRYPPIQPVCWRITERGREVIPFKLGDVVEAEAGGSGCLLIHRSVFERILPPYFRWTLGLKSERLEGMSEDFYFFRKARRAGFKFLIDTSIQCKHEVKQVVDANGKYGFLRI